MKPFESTFAHNIYLQKYSMYGLMSEVGEVMKKQMRDNRTVSTLDMMKELGDVLWYLNKICLDILQDRQRRNVISGSGDNR